MKLSWLQSWYPGRRTQAVAKWNPLSYYEQVRDEEHVFIFGVCGRSSTTALQRLLNSTRKICIWGEPGDYVVDRLATAICFLYEKMEHPEVAGRTTVLPKTFRKDNHQIVCAMAHGNWLPTADQMVEAFSQMWRPPIPVDRFGFKEIQITDKRTLKCLRTLYPKCRFTFTFRNPLDQWPSVQVMNWRYSRDLSRFLDLYTRLALAYIDFGGLFVQDLSLRSAKRIASLTNSLHLGHVDPRLINDGVFAHNSKPSLSAADEKTIRQSDAYTLYRKMQELDLTGST